MQLKTFGPVSVGACMPGDDMNQAIEATMTQLDCQDPAPSGMKICAIQWKWKSLQCPVVNLRTVAVMNRSSW